MRILTVATLTADRARSRGEMIAGDVLVAVSGTSVVGLPLRSVTALFKDGGGEGKEITLTLLRPTGGDHSSGSSG